MKQKVTKEEKQRRKVKRLFKNIRDDIFYFLEVGFGKTPQPLLPKYKNVPIEQWEAKHFGTIKNVDDWGLPEWEFPTFDRNKHITWQQTQIFHYVNQSKNLFKKGQTIPKKYFRHFQWKLKPNKELFKMMIAVVSGRGIGKTFSESIIILWALLQARDAQGACTSYSKELIYDILWKELSKTVRKLHPDLKELFDWRATRIAVSESPETWFISAKTGKKENPEALAGMHGQFVLLLGDEASGVPTEIFETALDGLTEEKYLVFMASNGRRLTGFFYEQCQNGSSFEVLKYNALESPLYKIKKAQDIVREEAASGGKDSDRFLIEVAGEFPHEEGLDEKGYKPLLKKEQLNIVDNIEFVGPKRMLIDYAGQGRDTTIWIIMDEFSTRIVHEEAISTDQSLDQKTGMLLVKNRVQDIIGDSFGIGASPLMRLSRKHDRVKGKNVGIPPLDKSKYANLRAEAYWKLREWVIKGGQLEQHKRWKDLLTVRYTRNLAGKIQIMDKLTMKKLGYKSPDAADALMLGFTEPIIDYEANNRRRRRAKSNRRRKTSGGYNMSAAGY